MSADPGPAPSSPFLAYVSPEDRSLTRAGVWLCLALPLAAFAYFLLGAVLTTFDRSLLNTPSGTGPHHLLGMARAAGLDALLTAMLMTPVLIMAQIAFQRPAWTFAAPTRLFSPKQFGWGVALGLAIALAIVGLNLLQGRALAPPILDASQPAMERAVFVISLIPAVLLMDAAQEILFRGVILQVSGAFLKTRIGLCVANGLINGLVQALLTQSLDPLVFLDVAVIGGAFAYAVLELGGLEFSIGAAFATDFAPMMLETSTYGARAFHWSDLAKLQAWIGLGEIAGVALVIVAAVRWLKRRGV